MILPKISRRAALLLGKAAGAAIFALVGGAAAWLLDRERRAIQAEAIRRSEEDDGLPEGEAPSAGEEDGAEDEA